MHIGNCIEDIRRRGSYGHWSIIFRYRHVSRIFVAACPGCITRNQRSGAARVRAVLGDEPLEVLKAAELSRVVPADRAAARRVVAVKVAVKWLPGRHGPAACVAREGP